MNNSEDEINMLRLEQNIDKVKTLSDNREQIIDLVFSNPHNYLKEEIFEELCNNIELEDQDVDKILIEELNFENLKIDLQNVAYIEEEIFVGEEDKPKTLETGSGSGTKIPDTEGFPKPRIDNKITEIIQR